MRRSVSDPILEAQARRLKARLQVRREWENLDHLRLARSYQEYVKDKDSRGERPLPKGEWESLKSPSEDKSKSTGLKSGPKPSRFKALLSKANGAMSKALGSASASVQRFVSDSAERKKMTKAMGASVRKNAPKAAKAMWNGFTGELKAIFVDAPSIFAAAAGATESVKVSRIDKKGVRKEVWISGALLEKDADGNYKDSGTVNLKGKDPDGHSREAEQFEVIKGDDGKPQTQRKARMINKSELHTLYGVGVYAAGTALAFSGATPLVATGAAAKAFGHSITLHATFKAVHTVVDELFLGIEAAESATMAGGLSASFGTGDIPGLNHIFDGLSSVASAVTKLGAEGPSTDEDKFLHDFMQKVYAEAGKVYETLSDEDIEAVMKHGVSVGGKTAKTFTLDKGDPLFTGKYLNSPGRIEEFGENDKGDPTVIVRKRPKGDRGQGAKKEVKLFKVRFDDEQAEQDKAEKTADMSDQASRALMKMLSEIARRERVAEHIYVVGGAVRNFVIEQPIKDIDVVIDSIAAGRDSEWFANVVAKAIPAKTSVMTDQYGVAKVFVLSPWELAGHEMMDPAQAAVEIANARKESYGGDAGKGYKPDNVEPTTIEQDVQRREFTFNCMAGDTLIPTERGILRIDQIASRDEGDHQNIRLTVAGQDGPSTAVGWQYSGFAPTLRVTTEWGHSFSCTHHHPVLVLRGHDHEWVQADQLEEGDLLCVPVRQVTRRTPLALDLPDPVQPKRGRLKDVRKPERMTPELAFLIGCIVAEGSNTHKRVSFSNSDPALISRYVECFHATFGFQPSRNKVVEKGSVRILRGVEFVASADGYDIYADSKAVVGWLEDLGLYCGGSKNGKSASHHKAVPWSILQADERSQWAFLAAYLEGDGSIRPDTGRITFCSASPHVRQQLQVLLGAHGILSKVKDRFVYINAEDSALLWEKIQPWMVTKGFDYTRRSNKARNRYGIPAEYIRGFLAGRKQDTGRRAVYATDGDGDGFRTLPDVHEPVRKVQRLLHDAHARGDFDGFMASLKVISPDEFAKLQRLFDLGYQYVEVTSVEDVGQQDVFDISMGERIEPAFVANGVVVHNTLMWSLLELAKGPDKAEILDLTGCGLQDLKDRRMQCPSDPDTTFSDDPSRMLRAIKFIVKYGMKLTPDTEASIKRNLRKLRNAPMNAVAGILEDTLLKDPSTAKKALPEMKRLGLLDVIADWIRDDKAFLARMEKWVRSKPMLFMFDLMDLGLPLGANLGFLDRDQQARLRQVALGMPEGEPEKFLGVLRQPGKSMDTRALIQEFGLQGRQIAEMQRGLGVGLLLDDPDLATNTRKFTDAVRQALRRGKAASGDPNEFLREQAKKRTPKTAAGLKVFLDDERDTPPGWKRVYWPDEAIRLLKAGRVSVISLDHDLGDDHRGTGYDVVLWIEKAVVTKGFVPPEIRVHSANTSARVKMEAGIRQIYKLHERFNKTAGSPLVQLSINVGEPQPVEKVIPSGSLPYLIDNVQARRVAAAWVCRKAGLFEAPPAMLEAVSSWMQATYAGHALAYAEEKLAAVSGGLGEVEKALREMKDAFRSFERNLDKLKRPGEVLRIKVYALRHDGSMETAWMGIKALDPSMFHTDEALLYDKAISAKRLTFKRRSRGSKKDSIVYWANSYLGDVISRLEASLKHHGTKGGPDTETTADLEGAVAEAKKYTSKGKQYSTGTKRQFAVDTSGWKYIRPGSPIIDKVNKALEVTNRNIRDRVELAEEELKLAQAYYKTLRARKPNQEAQEQARQMLDSKGYQLGNVTYSPFTVRQMAEKGEKPTQAIASIEGQGFPVDQVTYEEPLGPDGVDRALALARWDKITCVLVFKAHKSRGGVWIGGKRELQVDVDNPWPRSGEQVREQIEEIGRICRHEMQHVGQDLLRVALRLREDAGLPSSNISDPKYNPSGYRKDVSRYDERFRQDHALRDVEFYTRLSDEVERFMRATVKNPDQDWKAPAQTFVTNPRHPFFGPLKRTQPDKWKKAVGEFYKAVEKKVEALPKRTAAVGRLRGRPKYAAMLDVAAHWCGSPLVTRPAYGELDRMAARVAARYQKKKEVPKADGKGTMTVYEYSEGQVQHRNREKAKRIEKLRGSIDKLRSDVKKDLKSGDEQTRHTALAVGLMDHTFERVGNDGSAKDGHFGVTGWQKKHVSFSGSKATVKYVGKSGVSQTKTVTDKGLVSALKASCEGSEDGDCVTGSVSAGDVNKYLKAHDITAKDIRGFHANSEVQTRLKAIRSKGGKLPSDPKEKAKKLKDEFKQALEEAAEAVGHKPSTLKSQYLVPGLEKNYLQSGKVVEKLDKQGRDKPRRVASALARLATKSKADKDDEEAERLTRPAPTKKPPRKDLRRERVKDDDDLKDTGKANADNDKDLSLNYKKVARLYYAAAIQEEGDLELMRLAGGKVDKDEPKKGPGDYWEAKGGWRAWAPKADASTNAKDEEAAKAIAEGGGDSEDDEGGDKPDPKEEAAKAREKHQNELRRQSKQFESAADALMNGLDERMGMLVLGAFPDKGSEQFTVMAEAFEDHISVMSEVYIGPRGLSKDALDDASEIFEMFSPPPEKGESEGDGKDKSEEKDDEKDKKSEVKQEAQRAAARKQKLKDFLAGSPEAQAEMLARLHFAQRVVANPAVVGGRALRGLTEPDDLKERGTESARQYNKASPEIRAEAAKRAAHDLKEMAEDDPNRIEANAILDGLALAAGAHGESLEVDGAPVRPRMSKGHQVLLKHLFKSQNEDILLGSMDDFYGPAGREAVGTALSTMDDKDLASFGSSGHFKELAKKLTSDKVSDSQKAFIREFLKKQGIEDLTTTQELVEAAAGESGRAAAELDEEFNTYVSKHPQSREWQQKIKEVYEASNTDEALEEGAADEINKEYQRWLSQIRLEWLKSMGIELPPNHPEVARHRHVVETGETLMLDESLVQQELKAGPETTRG